MEKIRIILVLAIAAMFAGCTRVVPGTALFTPVEYVTTNEPSVPEGYFRNPILPGFYPDPSICRVGDDYWMVNSSFAYFPGLPVWHSTDLIHWESCGPALSRSHDFFLAPPSNIVTGSYAPQITFNPANGLYYIINTYVAGYWNFFITSPDPASGQWSEPTILPEVPGIDPSILFDQDGRAYIVSAPGRDAIGETKLYAEDNAIVLFDFDYEKGVTGERTVIARSGVHPEEQPNALEGPHLYHIGDKYFLMCAEGGTMLGHSEVIFEAPAVKGPYTPCPINPILTQRDIPDADIRCTGHADLVQSASGEWYAVFLGTESYDGEYNFNTGRQTFLHPVTWTEGQPVILPAGEKLPSQIPLNDDLKALGAANRISGVDTRQPGPLWNGRDGLSDQTLFIRNPVSGSLKGLTWEGGAAGSEDFDFNKGRFEGPFWHIRRSGKM
ncbi:MAG: glycoside hydrolase family 43 protein, partial [Bacteroidales bacterium]|nr:glycoside hydrolase family 43 protein [Bacteroidales bacterium]